MKALVLSSADILKCYDAEGLRGTMARALVMQAEAPQCHYPRQVTGLDGLGAMGFMPAFYPSEKVMGHKSVAVIPSNRQRGLNPHQGLVTLLDAESGEVQALLEGSTVTTLRTAAVSAAVSESLSHPQASTLALLGAGRQAYTHALALCQTRPIENIHIYNRSSDKAQKLAQRLREELDLKVEYHPRPQSAVESAQIVVSCTESRQALLDIADLPANCHVNAVGACRPGFHEFVLRDRENLKVYFDAREACLLEASEIIDGLEEKRLSEKSLAGEVGNFLKKSPSDKAHLSFFKSVGLGLEDVMAAEFFVQRARSLGLGTPVDLRGLSA